MFLDSLNLAVRNILHRKRRSWLTILGTTIGILAIVALLSIGQGLENSVEGEIQELGGNKVFVSPGGGGTSQRFTGTTSRLLDEDLRTLRNTRGVENVIGTISGSVLAEYRDETQYMTVNGVPVGESEDLVRDMQNVEMSEGRFLGPADTNSIVISEEGKTGLFEDDVNIRSKIVLEGATVRVVGTTSNGLGENGLYMSLSSAREVLNRSEGYDSVTAQVQQGFTPAEVEENIAENLRRTRNVEEGAEDFSTNTAEDIIRSFNNQLSIIRAVLLGIGGISLLVGGVGIMNTMYTAVAERTREIGVMKAVGATRKQVIGLFLLESGIIGLIGGVFGVLTGYGISLLASGVISSQLGTEFSPVLGVPIVAGSLAFAVFVGMISGVLPARKAANLEPAEALRYG